MRLFIALIALALLMSGVWLTLRQRGQTSFENKPLNLGRASPALTLPPASDMVPVQESREPHSGSIANPSAVQERPTSQLLPRESVSVPAADQSSTALKIEEQLSNFGYRVPDTPRSIDTVVLHSSYNASGGDAYDIQRIVKQYEDYGVSTHYLIGREGAIHRLVRENNIAYHAGVSKMPDGRKNVNDFSIGIELVGTETSGYTDKQYAALNVLIADIKTRRAIKHIVGHSDIAPGRKTDPWKFDWKRLNK